MEGLNGLQTLTFIGFEAQESGLPLVKCLENIDWFIEAVKTPTLYAALEYNVDDDAACNAVGVEPDACGNGEGTGQHEVDVDDTKAATAAVMRRLMTRPFGALVSVRQSLESIARCARKILWRHRVKFESVQAMDEQSARADVGPRTLKRTFVVLEAAEGKLEDKLHAGADILLECSVVWERLMPLSDQPMEQ